MKRLNSAITLILLACMGNKYNWTAAEIALLGRISDAQLGKLIGITRTTVTLKRQSLGIPVYDRCNWGQTEIDLLGRYPDAEVAKLTVRRVENVTKKREDLGIALQSMHNSPATVQPGTHD